MMQQAYNNAPVMTPEAAHTYTALTRHDRAYFLLPSSILTVLLGICMGAVLASSSGWIVEHILGHWRGWGVVIFFGGWALLAFIGNLTMHKLIMRDIHKTTGGHADPKMKSARSAFRNLDVYKSLLFPALYGIGAGAAIAVFWNGISGMDSRWYWGASIIGIILLFLPAGVAGWFYTTRNKLAAFGDPRLKTTCPNSPAPHYIQQDKSTVTYRRIVWWMQIGVSFGFGLALSAGLIYRDRIIEILSAWT